MVLGKQKRSGYSLGISFFEQRCPVDVRLGAVQVDRTVSLGRQAVVDFDFDPLAPLPEAEPGRMDGNAVRGWN